MDIPRPTTRLGLASTVLNNTPVQASCPGVSLPRVNTFFLEKHRILQSHLRLVQSNCIFFLENTGFRSQIWSCHEVMILFF